MTKSTEPKTFEPGKRYVSQFSNIVYTCQIVDGRLKLIYDFKGHFGWSVDVVRDGINREQFTEI